jgi:lipoyl(octanoyl) transferase
MSQNLILQIDPPQSGTVNMATDRQILDAVDAGLSGPVLRFYQWSEPTISLGYFQKEKDIELLDEHLRGLPVVRRITGGGAILHDKELTYSLTVPLRSNEPVNELYRLVHDIFIGLLKEKGIPASYRGFSDKGNSQRGPFFCFARHHELDIVTPEGKLLGSAQRRAKRAVLQHGSLILEKTWPQQPGTATGRDFDCQWFAGQAAGQIEVALADSHRM